MKISCFTFAISSSGLYTQFDGEESPWLHVHFPRQRKKITLYLAKYYGGDDLRVYRILNKESLLGQITPQLNDLTIGKLEKNSWDIFNEYACLEDLVYESANISPELGEKELETLRVNGMCLLQIKDKERGDLFLETLRDYPQALHEPEVRRLFVRTLIAAKYDATITESLHKHFIPKSPGGKKPVPDNILFAEELMDRLAKHLKKICMNNSGITVKPHVIRGRGRELDPATYTKLIKWAGDRHEHRIKLLSNEDLSRLLYSTKTYNKNLLLNYLKVSEDTYSRRVRPA